VPSRIRSWLSQAFFIVAGAAIVALAYSLFLIPHRIVPGGVGGMAMILNYFFHWPVGAVILALNIPLFLLGFRVLGRAYAAKSLLGVAVSSVLIDGATYMLHIRPATDNPILACIFGGILLGAGLGLVFRGGGSTGGSDIVGQVINQYSNLSTGTAILVVDALVISAAGICFRNFELALFGYLNLYLQTRAIDLVLEGLSYTRAMFIVSDRAEAIAVAVNKELRRGATVLNATGAWTGENKPMVFCVMAKRQVSECRDVARDIDPRAFIIITDVYEVLGEGFKPRT
jgi:uncharacterized membrane-anchored protein YitT (DUF2179 family)